MESNPTTHTTQSNNRSHADHIRRYINNGKAVRIYGIDDNGDTYIHIVPSVRGETWTIGIRYGDRDAGNIRSSVAPTIHAAADDCVWLDVDVPGIAYIPIKLVEILAVAVD